MGSPQGGQRSVSPQGLRAGSPFGVRTRSPTAVDLRNSYCTRQLRSPALLLQTPPAGQMIPKAVSPSLGAKAATMSPVTSSPSSSCAGPGIVGFVPVTSSVATTSLSTPLLDPTAALAVAANAAVRP